MQQQQQQQHLLQMQPMMSAYYPSNVTTDHIQQYLDENKSLILKIVESQTSGKLGECAENQARLQRNLMYLAAIADSQPQLPTIHPQVNSMQYPSSGIIQAGGAHCLQHQQAQQMTPQSLMAARSSMLYSQQQLSLLQQQQALHGQMGMGCSGSTGLHMLQNEAAAGGSAGLGAAGFLEFGRAMAGGSKHEMGSAGSTDARMGSSAGSDGGEVPYLKVSDDVN